ncbi:MAG TPA: glycosyltransferase family 4 protein [Armatimonadota bacterium]|nr:glycosyltransferase family 4 protein [Armatimonadota bacterium]
MRIALVQTPTAPLDLEHTGGLEVVELNQLRVLRARGYAAHLYAAQVVGQMDGVCHLRDFGWRGRLTQFGYYWNLGRRERQADVFHGHYTPALALTHPRKSVIHFHGMAVHGMPLYRRFAERCHQAHLVFCARWVMEHHQELYPDFPDEHRHVIYNGVDHAAFCPPSEPRPEKSPVRIIFYAGWLPEKGVYELLDAAAILAQRRSDFEILFGGSAFSHYRREESDEIDRCVREKAARVPAVKLIGHIAHADLPELLRSADIGVVPSVYEDPFPLVPLEMMGAGLPVVAFAAGGLKEAVVDGESGILVPNRGVEALAKALERLVVDRQLRLRMGANARARVERELNWDRHVDQLLALYERVASANR